jgi:hypothetical protein
MKQATAANLAVLFVALAWMALFIGATLLIADPRPGTPSAEIEATRHLALAIECVGYLLILCSIWLSGYSFVAARWRSIFAMLACLVAFGVQIYYD